MSRKTSFAEGTSPQIPEDSSKDHALDAISDEPLFPLNTSETQNLFKIFVKSSVPATLGILAIMINGVICLRFVGSLNDPYMLAGASLANTWASGACIGIIFAINLGFAVVAAQAYGAQQYRRLGILYQRNLFVLGIIGVPLVLSLLLAESILNWMGLDPKTSMNVGIYLTGMIPSMIGILITEATKTFLIVQNIFSVGSIIQVIVVILNYFWCTMMIDVLGFSLGGVAKAKSITDVIGAVIICCYCKYSDRCKDTWIPWDKEAIQEWVPYLKQALTIGSALYIEWISIEASVAIAGALNDKYVLGAHGLAFSVMGIAFTPCIGNMTAIETYVGNAAGAGHKNKAQKVTFVAFCLNLIYCLINIVILLSYSEEIASYFTQDPIMKNILSTMLFYYACYHLMDSFASHLGVVLRTLGQEKQVFKRFLICYMGIAVNCEWFFAIALGFGYKGIWFSLGLGMTLMFLWMSYALKQFDWDAAIYQIRKELKEKEEAKEGGEYVEMV